MGSQINIFGEFQSDKHPWLPVDTILINPEREQSRGALAAFLGATCSEFSIRQPTAVDRYPKTKFIVFFEDPRNIPLLSAVASAYDSLDSEFSDDIRGRMLVLHPGKF